MKPSILGKLESLAERHNEVSALLADAETIAGLVREIDGPLNVVVGLTGEPFSLAQLRDLGVRRVSIGGSLARATFATIRRAAEEMAHSGTFRFSRDAIPDAKMCALFGS